MPMVPILPGLGSLLGLILGFLAYRYEPGRRWIAGITIVVSSGGLTLMLIQLVAVLTAALAAGR